MCEECSPKDRRNRRVQSVTTLPTSSLAMAGQLVESTRAKLAELDREDAPAGALALMLAGQLEDGQHTGSQAAALAKAYLQALTEATKGVTGASSTLDELRKRREQRRRGA
jgi:hypothetical protein